MPYGLYLHIPYCRSRCAYCDFYSCVSGQAVPAAYTAALLRDFDRYAPRDSKGETLRPATVYFGGGTPSLLAPAQVEGILAHVCPQADAEITLEANPDSLTEEKLTGYRAAGVNRLSIGVQTARDGSLRCLGRRHTAASARLALRAALRAGFSNISGDIMLALPGYTDREFDETLDLLAEGGAAHISAYLLKIESGTPFYKNPPDDLPTADEAAAFYLHAVEVLAAAGYAQYEISNFSRPGHEGRHNLIYWDSRDYLGLGPASHSCLEGRRFSFAASAAAFIAGTLTPQEEGSADADDYIMLRLRLAAGLDEQALARRYGVPLTARQKVQLQTFAQHGLALQNGSCWALTPQGMLVQNSILAQLL